MVDETSRVGAGAPGHVPGASDRPAAERPRLMARLSQLRPLGLETIKLYVALVASAGVALFVFLILAGRFDFSAEAPGVYWPGGLRRVMFALFVLLGELIPITVPRGNEQTVPSNAGTATEQRPVAGHTFCGTCGTKAEPGDKFCRTCGRPI